MMNLISFSPFMPSPGLAIWSVIIFLLFWFIMSRVAFNPIADALSKREKDIQDSLDEAKKAREEMSRLNAENEEILAKAREEKLAILKEANEAKINIISDAKTKAKEEAQRIVNNAKVEADNEKKAAFTEVKNTVGAMAIDIAEKIIKKDLAGNKEQEALVNDLVKEMNLN